MTQKQVILVTKCPCKNTSDRPHCGNSPHQKKAVLLRGTDKKMGIMSVISRPVQNKCIYGAYPHAGTGTVQGGRDRKEGRGGALREGLIECDPATRLFRMIQHGRLHPHPEGGGCGLASSSRCPAACPGPTHTARVRPHSPRCALRLS